MAIVGHLGHIGQKQPFLLSYFKDRRGLYYFPKIDFFINTDI